MSKGSDCSLREVFKPACYSPDGGKFGGISNPRQRIDCLQVGPAEVFAIVALASLCLAVGVLPLVCCGNTRRCLHCARRVFEHVGVGCMIPRPPAEASKLVKSAIQLSDGVESNGTFASG